jgi:ApbE superfamily uncharacterized protein (UPF0280 family)
VQRALVAGGVAQGLVELELQDAGEEVARVGDVGGDVVLRAGVEGVLGAGVDGGDALVLRAQLPPARVVVGGRRLAGEEIDCTD